MISLAYVVIVSIAAVCIQYGDGLVAYGRLGRAASLNQAHMPPSSRQPLRLPLRLSMSLKDPPLELCEENVISIVDEVKTELGIELVASVRESDHMTRPIPVHYRDDLWIQQGQQRCWDHRRDRVRGY
jgi:hypothetical protein